MTSVFLQPYGHGKGYLVSNGGTNFAATFYFVGESGIPRFPEKQNFGYGAKRRLNGRPYDKANTHPIKVKDISFALLYRVLS